MISNLGLKFINLVEKNKKNKAIILDNKHITSVFGQHYACRVIWHSGYDRDSMACMHPSPRQLI